MFRLFTSFGMIWIWTRTHDPRPKQQKEQHGLLRLQCCPGDLNDIWQHLLTLTSWDMVVPQQVILSLSPPASHHPNADPMHVFAQELAIFFVVLRLRGRASPTLTGTFADAFIKLVSHLTWMWNWWKPPLRWRNQNLESNRFTGHAFPYGLGCQRWLHLFLQLCLVASMWKKNTTGEDCFLGFGQRTKGLTGAIPYMRCQTSIFHYAFQSWPMVTKEEDCVPKHSWCNSFQFVISHLGPFTTNTSGCLDDEIYGFTLIAWF